MSGGGSPYGGGFGGGPDEGSCHDLKFDAQVHSLTDAAQDVKVGDVLDVRLDDRPAVVVVVPSTGDVVGAIVANVTRLLDCLRQGVDYLATVTTAADGDLQVTVRPA